MPPDRSSAGDPARTLALLWRDADRRAPARGPRPGLSVDRVVDAAVELADRDGLAAVTVRRVAEALGIAPMSVYTYVPGKAELLDLMVDAVGGETARPGRVAGGWRDRLEQVARENWALYRRHPWLVHMAFSRENLALYRRHPWVAAVSTVRPPLGPGLIAKYDHELRAFEGLGLGDVEQDAALEYLLSFVQASARAAIDARASRRDSGQTDAQWWERNAPLLARVFDAERFPVAVRVGTAAGTAHQAAQDPAYSFEFGLARVLDGLAALIGR
jgi:AcrR family transcriptional regulator